MDRRFPGAGAPDQDVESGRLIGALTRLILGLALAVASFFVPFMNVVMTPAFLILGAVLAWKYWDEH